MVIIRPKRFDSPEDINEAAKAFDRIGLHPDFLDERDIRLHVSPGLIRLSYRDASHDEFHDVQERLQGTSVKSALSNKVPISHWSSASRRKLMFAMGELDYGPMFQREGRRVGMVTLTLPGDWMSVAPTGKALKRLMEKFFDRYERAWGPLLCVWKLEFQRRGAPHIHFFTDVPYAEVSAVKSRTRTAFKRFEGLVFGDWLKATWADVCNAPDPGERAKHELAGAQYDFNDLVDPYDVDGLRVYFVRHAAPGKGSKEYQHRVPDEWMAEGSGPGRFWGYRGLRKVTQDISLSGPEAVKIKRVLRRMSADAPRDTRTVHVGGPRVMRRRVPRHQIDPATGEVKTSYRTVTRRARLFTGHKGGALMVKSGASIAHALARLLSIES